jgi:hypothetical protein
MMGDACRSCHAPIIWAYTRTGIMPLDAEPAPAGNIRVTWVGWPPEATPSAHATILNREQAQDAGEPLYVSHFATCPQASTWRKRGPG